MIAPATAYPPRTEGSHARPDDGGNPAAEHLNSIDLPHLNGCLGLVSNFRRTALAVSVAIAAFSAVASTAMAADVRVEFARDNRSRTVSLSELEPQFDVDRSYEIRSASGSTQTQIRGISITTLLAAVKAELRYGGVEIVRPEGGTVFISKSQIDTGVPAPVVYESGGQVSFLRPSYAANDVNAADLVSTSGTLVIRQTDKPRIKVVAKASKGKAKIRELVRFSATVTGAGAGENFTVKWRFRDGTTVSGLEVSHRFKKRGSYAVIATVETSGRAPVNHSDVAPVQIGKPGKNKTNRSGGGNNDASGAPDSGASDGDSGGGKNAPTDTGDETPKRTNQRAEPQPDPTLPQVTGQLLDPTVVTPEEQSSDLVARSGQPVQQAKSSGGVPGEALAGAGTFGLLALGFLFELGVFRGRP